MQELLHLVDEELEYIDHEISGSEIRIHAKSKRKEATCPYCGEPSKKVHSRAKRTLKDLPIQSKKVKIILEINKYFCKNPKCAKKTFVERYAFFEPNATRTRRLNAEILRVSLTQSSISAAQYLRASVTDVGKSTICNMLKKGHFK